VTRLFAWTEADLQSLRERLAKLDEIDPVPAKASPPDPLILETNIFGKLQTELVGVSSSGNPGSATLDQYKFTSTGGTSATGDTPTVYNLTHLSPSTVGFTQYSRESRSGLFMFQPAGQSQFVTASLTTALDPGTTPNPKVDNVVDQENNAQSAIATSRIFNTFNLAGANNDGVLLQQWGTQATTTGGTESIYRVLQINHRLHKLVDDIRVTTGTTDVIEGHVHNFYVTQVEASSTWTELVVVGACTS